VGDVASVGNVGNGWQASIDLGFAWTGGTTHLSRRAHRGPLVVQRPFRPEGPGVCHVYLLHPPGGLVGCEKLEEFVLALKKPRIITILVKAGGAVDA